MNYKIVGIDLAKNVFQVCALNQAGKVLFNKKITRKRFSAFIQQLPPTVIAMEACGSANYWGRKFRSMGHEVRLVPAQYVKPFVRGNKNDRNDSQAICEAALRPKMHFVPVKSIEHQDLQILHRIRQRYIQSSTALANQIRAYLRENGIVIAKSLSQLNSKIPLILEDAENELTPMAREMIQLLFDELNQVRGKINMIDHKLKNWINQNEDCQRLMSLPGYGPIIATALIAAIGSGQQFKKSRSLSAWIGLTPRHVSSGDKITVLSTSKKGSSYLRSLLIHGARSVVRWSKNKDDRLSLWIQDLIKRRGKHKAIVALANKTARVAQALLTKKETYQPDLINNN